MSQQPEDPASRDANSRVENALRTFRADRRPRADWQARVLASVRAAEVKPVTRTRWWLSMIPVFAGAAALAIFYVWPARAEPPRLAMEVTAQGRTTRGQDPHAGDLLRISASHGKAQRAVWIFHGRTELVLACPGGPGCNVGQAAASVELRLPRVGEYTVVALWATTAIAAPQGTRDEALAAAAKAGVIQQSKTLVVH
jgi:hypothetical protein